MTDASRTYSRTISACQAKNCDIEARCDLCSGLAAADTTLVDGAVVAVQGLGKLDVCTDDPAVAFDPEGKQICMARKTDGSLWSGVQDTPSGGDWHEHIVTTGIASDPKAIRDSDGRVLYVVRKTDGGLWEGRQDLPLATTWHEHALR